MASTKIQSLPPPTTPKPDRSFYRGLAFQIPSLLFGFFFIPCLGLKRRGKYALTTGVYTGFGTGLGCRIGVEGGLALNAYPYFSDPYVSQSHRLPLNPLSLSMSMSHLPGTWPVTRVTSGTPYPGTRTPLSA